MTNTQKSKTHFFASFGLGWATAATEKEAIEKLINGFRSEFKTMSAIQIKENQPGAYIWVCEVNAPAGTAYAINFFQPQDVEILNSTEAYVTRVTAKSENYFLIRDFSS